LARTVKYDESLTSGEDFVFWIGTYARAGFAIRVTPRRSGAVYYRTVRPGSVSRRKLSYDFNVRQRLDCVAALNRIPEHAKGTSKLVRWATGGQAERIRDYLTAHPDQHAQVRADAGERGLDVVIPWRQINRGMARDLAVLYCFTPYVDTSALVAARRIRERGVITDVISQEMDNVRTTDQSSEQIAQEFLDEVRILPGNASFSAWGPTRRFAEAVVREARAMQAYKGKYRTLYSRAMAPQSHLAAALLKLESPALVWTAEFSDPLLMNAYGEERVGDIEEGPLIDQLRSGIVAAGFDPPDTPQLFAWAELVAYVLADEIVFTNEHQREFMLGYCRDRRAADRAAAIARVSHHPTLPERYYRAAPIDYALSPGRVHIGYFGNFYLTRGLTEVIAALEALSLTERNHVRLHVFTDEPEELELDVLRRGLTDVIDARPYVPFLQFLNLCTQFDALLVNDAATSRHHTINPYLPSKLSDYRGSGTPIWAIYEPGSVLSRQDVDHASVLGDVTGATDVLRTLIDRGSRKSGARAWPKTVRSS
jgi:poly(ribitol-phosphate) beta-N-acetylglucosaminyltransferase